MKCYYFAFIIMLINSGAALAKDIKFCKKYVLDKGLEASVDYTPGGADYEPGIDAYGNPVVSADLPSDEFQMTVPDRVEMDLQVDLMEDLSIIPPEEFELEAKIGTIVYESGVVSYNGQPLTGAQADSLYALCLDTLKEEGKSE